MHEAGIVQELLVAADQAARKAGCRTIHRIRIRVGRFSSAVPEAIEFAFEALKEGTPAAGASLQIERIPATAWCARCEREFELEDLISVCPGCSEPSRELRRGFELDLLEVEAD